MAILGGRNYLRVDAAGDLPTLAAADDGTVAIVLADTPGVYRVWDGAAWQTISGGTVSNPVTIAQGGTGQTSKTPAFDALSPLTTKGDLVVFDGTNNIRVAVGANRKLIQSDTGAGSGISYTWHNTSVTLYAGAALNNYVTTASYAAVFGTDSPTRMKMDFSGYREARIILRGSIQVASVSGDVKIRDITNSQDITGTVTLNSTTVSTLTGGWTSINSATYAGDAEFEAQAIQGVAADVLRFENIQLELR